jgi:hypothetical protein
LKQEILMAIFMVVFNQLDQFCVDPEPEPLPAAMSEKFYSLACVSYLQFYFAHRRGKSSGKLSVGSFMYWLGIARACRDKCDFLLEAIYPTDTGESIDHDESFSAATLLRRLQPWLDLVRRVIKYPVLTDVDILLLLVYNPDSHCRVAIDPAMFTGLGLQCVKDVRPRDFKVVFGTAKDVRDRSDPAVQELIGAKLSVVQWVGTTVMAPDLDYTPARVLAKQYPIGRFGNTENFRGKRLWHAREPNALRARRDCEACANKYRRVYNCRQCRPRNNAKLAPDHTRCVLSLRAKSQKIHVGEAVYYPYSCSLK